MTSQLIVRRLGTVDYTPTWEAMKLLTDNRDETSPDEIWLLQHPPVFTQGQAGKPEHLLFPGDIPVIQVDRGGQVTYHGPGQLVAYVMIDIKRRGMGPRALVSLIEQSIIDALSLYGVTANARKDAPGVYVNDAKIASLGLRIRKGRSFHGLSINVDMDMEPYSRINPCGYQGMEIIQLSQFDSASKYCVSQNSSSKTSRVNEKEETLLIDDLADKLLTQLTTAFGYETVSFCHEPFKQLNT
jgi:lipoyl(octanoyl) transferase